MPGRERVQSLGTKELRGEAVPECRGGSDILRRGEEVGQIAIQKLLGIGGISGPVMESAESIMQCQVKGGIANQCGETGKLSSTGKVAGVKIGAESGQQELVEIVAQFEGNQAAQYLLPTALTPPPSL